jgi:hypothetical protein
MPTRHHALLDWARADGGIRDRPAAKFAAGNREVPILEQASA